MEKSIANKDCVESIEGPKENKPKLTKTQVYFSLLPPHVDVHQPTYFTILRNVAYKLIVTYCLNMVTWAPVVREVVTLCQFFQTRHFVEFTRQLLLLLWCENSSNNSLNLWTCEKNYCLNYCEFFIFLSHIIFEMWFQIFEKSDIQDLDIWERLKNIKYDIQSGYTKSNLFS